MDIQLGSPSSINYLWLVLVVVVAIACATVARRQAMHRFATSDLIGSVFPKEMRTQWLTSVLAIAALIALMPALCDIRWGKTWREVPQKGIEVVFALDVSRSMLAEDVAPNRLERAKQQIKDIVDEMTGDRVGLVVFAGNAVRKIPLTSHYHDFKLALDAVGLSDVTRGGSDLGEALRVSAGSFLAKTTDHKAVVLFTDGEGHKSDPIGVAKNAHKNEGIRVFTVGLGDDRQGAKVPASSGGNGNRYLKHDGQQVWSKLDGRVLKEIALASNGAYIPAGTKQVNMAQVYHNYVANVEQQDFQTARINSYVPRFQWFVGAALVLCIAEALTSSTRGRLANRTRSTPPKQRAENRRRRRVGMSNVAAMVVTLLVLGGGTELQAARNDVYALADQGSRAMSAGEYDKASALYAQAVEANPQNSQLRYNQAIALYRNGETDAARSLFTEVTASADRELEAKARFNLANCDYAEALRLSKQDRESAKSKTRSAISHYRGAIALNPADADARTNIELAAILLRQLSEQPPDQHDHDPEQESSQQSSDDNSKAGDQESESEDQSSQQQNSGSESQQESATDRGTNQPAESESENEGGKSKDESQADEQNGDSSQEGGQEQSDTGDAATTDSDETPKSNNDSSSSDAADSPADAAASTDQQRQSQSSAEESADESIDDARGTPDRADDESKKAAPDGTLRSVNEDASAADKNDAETTDVDGGQAMTRQEAMKMLQSVRDRDLMRRLQNARRSQRRYIPGDKDW